MKNTLVAIICCIFAIIIIPLLNLQYKIDDIQIIKVLNTVDNKVYEMDLEYYITKALAKEMSPTFEKEALKAQAVAIRTFVLKRIDSENKGHRNADVCTDYNHCMAYLYDTDSIYGNKKEEYLSVFKDAVLETKGEVVKYNGEIASVYFHAMSGGKTQNSKDVWGGDLPYLTSVNSDFDKDSEKFESNTEFSVKELSEKLKVSETNIKNFIIRKFDSGYVDNIKFGDMEFGGEEIRKTLGLRSSCFDVAINKDKIIFTVFGYGHGVGMSQNGANVMAKRGANYKEILKHYYSGTEIEKHLTKIGQVLYIYLKINTNLVVPPVA